MNGEIFDLLESGNALSNPLTSISSGATSAITDGHSNISNVLNLPSGDIKNAITAGGLTTSALNTGTATLTSAAGGITTVVDYGAQTVSETFSRVGAVNAYTNGLTAIGRAPTSCDTVNSAFKILQETGEKWMKAVEDTISDVNAKLNALMDEVNKGAQAVLAQVQVLAAQVKEQLDKALVAVNAVLQEIEDGIKEELAHLEELGKKCVNFCMSSEVFSWMKDSCVAAAIHKMATPSLKTLIS